MSENGLDFCPQKRVKFKVRLSQAPTGPVTIRVRPEQTGYDRDAQGNILKTQQVTLSSTDSRAVVDGQDLLITFDSSNYSSSVNVVVTAKQDSLTERDDFVTVPSGNRSLSEIDGVVYAEGEGGSGSAMAPMDPLMVRYDDGNRSGNPNLNETNEFEGGLVATFGTSNLEILVNASDLPAGVSIAQLASQHYTVQAITGINDAATERVRQIETASTLDASGAPLANGMVRLTLNEAYIPGTGELQILVKNPRPSLFVDEVSLVDRIFINNIDDQAARTSTLERLAAAAGDEYEEDLITRTDAMRVSGTLLQDGGNSNHRGIVYGDFELAEINLGSGSDTVTVRGAHSRDDGFQTLTILNTGDERTGSGDNIAVESYLASDCLLAINAQMGDDTIDAYGNGTYNVEQQLVVFGGLGDDTIDVGTQGIVFGDRGQVTYREESISGENGGAGNLSDRDVVTLLGSTDGGSDYTTAATVDESVTKGLTVNGQVLFQTDGVRREAVNYRTMDNGAGGDDQITVHGANNFVFGGAGADTILVKGGDNVAFGDGGQLHLEQLRAGESLQWGDTSEARITKAESTDDSLGDVDQITVEGAGRNILMGGAQGDQLTSAAGDDIIVGDGGEVLFDVNESWERVSNVGRTVAGDDTIDAGTGANTVLGGMGNDAIVTGVDRASNAMPGVTIAMSLWAIMVTAHSWA